MRAGALRSCALVPLAIVAGGCTETHTSVLPYPIPLELSGDGGGLEIGRAHV